MSAREVKQQPGAHRFVMALLVGAGFGGIAGPISGCQVSGIVWEFGGRCAPGGALAGSVLGAGFAALALPALTMDARRIDQRRLVTATGLVGLIGATGVAALLQSWAQSEPGLDQLGPFLATLAVVPALVGLVALMKALLRGRAWATWLSIVGGSISAVAGAASLIGSIWRAIPHGLKASVAASWPAALATAASAGVVWILATAARSTIRRP